VYFPCSVPPGRARSARTPFPWVTGLVPKMMIVSVVLDAPAGEARFCGQRPNGTLGSWRRWLLPRLPRLPYRYRVWDKDNLRNWREVGRWGGGAVGQANFGQGNSGESEGA
jgi:hypothetical protein